MNKDLKVLAIDLLNKRTYEQYTEQEMRDSFRKQVNNLVCDTEGKITYHSWNRGKLEVFELMATMIEEILPKKVYDVLGKFADIKTYGNGDKPRFTLKKGRQNVKRFVTKVAAAGVYERVRLDRDYLDVETYAHGGAIYQTIEAFLAGREDITEVLDIMLEGLEESIYADITTALEGTVSELPAANSKIGAYDAGEFNKILATVRAYGQPVIFCTQVFAANLVPETGFVGDADKADMRNQGYIGRYMGADIVILPQSFKDANNEETVINDNICYIMPGGANAEKPVKVAFEGETLVRSLEREDWSMEMQLYKKIGVAITNTNHYGMYSIPS